MLILGLNLPNSSFEKQINISANIIEVLAFQTFMNVALHNYLQVIQQRRVNEMLDLHEK